jgi:hypothetical protein
MMARATSKNENFLRPDRRIGDFVDRPAQYYFRTDGERNPYAPAPHPPTGRPYGPFPEPFPPC